MATNKPGETIAMKDAPSLEDAPQSALMQETTQVASPQPGKTVNWHRNDGTPLDSREDAFIGETRPSYDRDPDLHTMPDEYTPFGADEWDGFTPQEREDAYLSASNPLGFMARRALDNSSLGEKVELRASKRARTGTHTVYLPSGPVHFWNGQTRVSDAQKSELLKFGHV